MWLKLILGGALFAALISGGLYVKHVIAKNATQAMTIKLLAQDVVDANAERDKAREEAQTVVAKMEAEIKLTNKLAADSVAKNEALNRRLSHANAALETWKLSSAVAAAALGQPMPDGVLPRPKAGPTAAIYRDPCIASSPSYDAATGTCARTIAEGLRLGNEMQKAFRACNLKLEQLQEWSAAQPAP